MADNTILKVVKLSANARLPYKASPKAAGYDLFSAEEYTIPPGAKQLCSTDIKIAVPDGCYGRIAPRSGLASKYFIHTGAGVLDSDYIGAVYVLLFNFGSENFYIKKFDRIAQLICERICHPEVQECSSLDETKRGENAFGSSG